MFATLSLARHGKLEIVKVEYIYSMHSSTAGTVLGCAKAANASAHAYGFDSHCKSTYMECLPVTVIDHAKELLFGRTRDQSTDIKTRI